MLYFYDFTRTLREGGETICAGSILAVVLPEVCCSDGNVIPANDALFSSPAQTLLRLFSIGKLRLRQDVPSLRSPILVCRTSYLFGFLAG